MPFIPILIRYETRSLRVDPPSLTRASLLQVKYELLRRVRVDGDSVSHATSLFALSRPTFYAALVQPRGNNAGGYSRAC